MAKQKLGTGGTCGKCREWRESLRQSPGMGFCRHVKAPLVEVSYKTPLSCRFLPAKQECLLSADA